MRSNILDVNASSVARPAASADELARLRAHIERIERTTRIGSDAPAIPAPPALARLLPGGGLRTGAAYSLGRSMPLLASLLAVPSAGGTWCAVVGMPEIGIETAEWSGLGRGYGCLDRGEAIAVVTARRGTTPRKGRIVLAGEPGSGASGDEPRAMRFPRPEEPVADSAEHIAAPDIHLLRAAG